jgi:hypothetical protein
MLGAESDVSETPTEPGSQFVQCAKCGTRNPAEVTQCLGCGGPLAPPVAVILRRMPLRWRLLVSGLIGVLVFGIAGDTAYRRFCHSYARRDQWFTALRISKVAEALEAYHDENHTLPGRLSDIDWASADADIGIAVDEDGTPVDAWQRALHYPTDGRHYRVTSYGADGRPGGSGLDYDLSSRDPAEAGQAEVGIYGEGLPPQSVPTLQQFVDDDDPARGGSGRMMFLMSILAGVVAAALALRTTGRETPAQGGAWPRVRGLLIVTVATLLIAIMYLIPLHLPSGH